MEKQEIYATGLENEALHYEQPSCKKAALLGTARILRKPLDTLSNFFQLKLTLIPIIYNNNNNNDDDE